MQGIIKNCSDVYDYVGETLRDTLEEELITPMKGSTHMLSDLIIMLLDELKTGDKHVIYHDQNQSVFFNNPKNIMASQGNVLLFGGFHSNGDEFEDLMV